VIALVVVSQTPTGGNSYVPTNSSHTAAIYVVIISLGIVHSHTVEVKYSSLTSTKISSLDSQLYNSPGEDLSHGCSLARSKSFPFFSDLLTLFEEDTFPFGI
jgi:hypothetical protein